MATGNMTKLDEPYWSPVERGFFSATLLAIMVVAIVGNSLVMIVIIRNRGMRTRTNLLLFNLAMTDLSACVFDMPFSLVTLITGRWIFSDALCMFMGFTTPLFVIASIHTLMYMSIHKFVTVRNPHSHALTKRRILVLNAAAWTWAVIASALSISGLTSVDHASFTTQCSPKNPDSPSSYAHLVLAIITCYAVPVVIIVVCSFGVWRAIRSYGRRMRDSSTVDADELYAQQRHITVTLFLVVTVFIICWTPVVCYAIYSTVMNSYGRIDDPLANPITTLFAFANSACNPIIYAFRSESFREGYKQLICFRKSKRRASTSSISTGFHRGGTAINRSSTASTVAISRNASNAANAARFSAGSGRAPTAADYNAALNASGGLEKDVTISTFLYEDDSHLPPSAEGLEMNVMSLNRSSGVATNSDRHFGTTFNGDLASGRHSATDRQVRDDHQHHMVSFSDAEELDERHQMTSPGAGNVVRSKPGLKSYLSVEHLDTMDESHHHHRHHHDDSTGSNHRKHRKFRGKIGGLHRNRDSADAENDAEVAALSAGHEHSEQRHLSPAVQSIDSDHGRWGASGAAANDSAHRPIYKKSGDERPMPTPRPTMQTAAVDAPAVRATTPAMSVNSYVSGRPNVPVLTPEEPPLSRRVATSEWVAQQQKSVSPSTDVAAPRLQPQQPRSSRASGGGDRRRPVVDEVVADTSQQGSVGGRRSKSQSARGAPSTSSSTARNRTDNGVNRDAAEVQTDQSTTGAPRTSGRRVSNSAILDTSRSTEI